MGIRASEVLYYLYHYDQLRAMIQWKTWHNPVHQRNPENESPSLKICFHQLDKTSRSFSAVIKELHPELLVPVVVFYLILRGLDTVEDDMTIPLETKEPLLRTFHTIIDKEGWNFNGNGPNEKDRELLVQFENVIEEFNKIKPVYREIIKDITNKMGNGMADYANNAEHNAVGVNTVADYDLYCHHVAGLVGEGLTRLFVVSELANPALLERPQLHESMGQFLQNTNIIRDIHEDFEDKRSFWPKEVWSKYVDKFEDLFNPKNIDIAMNCSSEMILNALGHVNECIFYLAGIREQSVFNFTTIPQTMAIATLEAVFRNPKLFRENVKITKGQACQIMLESTQNLRVACEVFKKFTRKIQKKNNPRDPNFLQISIACGKIEQFIESLYPSVDPKTIGKQPSEAELKRLEAKKVAEKESFWDTMYLLLAVMGVLFFISALMIGVAWYMGARIDVAFSEIKQGRFARPDPAVAQEAIKKYDHGEL